MWGVVTDATTGAPIGGAKVTLTDQRGQSVTTTTDEQGVFSLSPTNLAPLFHATIKAQAPGYGAITQLLGRNPTAFELLRGTFAYYHDKVMHLSLFFPAGWTIGDPDTVPLGDASAPDDKNTFCVMMADPITGGSLDSTMNNLLAVIGIFDTNYKFAKTVDTTVKGLPAVKTREYPADGSFQTRQGASESLNYLIGLNDTWAYNISCQTSEAQYRQWEPKFEAIVHSLTLDK